MKFFEEIVVSVSNGKLSKQDVALYLSKTTEVIPSVVL
jgi:hypothetical protein